MRNVLILATLVLCTTFAGARERRQARAPKQVVSDLRLAYVDDEPMSRAALTPPSSAAMAEAAEPTSPLVSGSRMPIQFQAPQLTTGSSAAARTDERRPADEPVAVRIEEPHPVAVALEALAEVDMKKHQASIHACTSQAVRRQPQLAGKVQLRLTVGDGKVAATQIGESTVDDPQLEHCLTKAAASWTFDSLANAELTWSVVVSKSLFIAASH
jgi:hypothetical protein